MQEYKEALAKPYLEHSQVHYANMLEVVRTLRMFNNANSVGIEEQQAFEWYNGFTPKLQKLKEARMDLLVKYYELLNIQNDEVMQIQLAELTNSFKNLVLASGLEPINIEKLRKNQLIQLGGFNGVYLEKVSRVVSHRSY